MEQTLTTFNFHLDTKITTWMRTTFEIEAENLEEAKKKAIEFHNEGNTESIGWDEMDTQEQMSVGDNGGQPTKEILLDSGECIWDNTEIN